MGLFSQQGTCSLCQTTTSVKQLKDGVICDKCIDRSGAYFSLQWQEVTQEEAKRRIEANQESQRLLHIARPNKSVGEFLSIDEMHHLWFLPSSHPGLVFRYRDLVSYEILPDSDSVPEHSAPPLQTEGQGSDPASSEPSPPRLIRTVLPSGPEGEEEMNWQLTDIGPNASIRLETKHPFFPSILLRLPSPTASQEETEKPESSKTDSEPEAKIIPLKKEDSQQEEVPSPTPIEQTVELLDIIVSQVRKYPKEEEEAPQKNWFQRHWWKFALCGALCLLLLLPLLPSIYIQGSKPFESGPYPVPEFYQVVDQAQSQAQRLDQVVAFVQDILAAEGYTVADQMVDWIGYTYFAMDTPLQSFESQALGGYYLYTGHLTTGELVSARVAAYWDDTSPIELLNLSILMEDSSTIYLMEYQEEKMTVCWEIYQERVYAQKQS